MIESKIIALNGLGDLDATTYCSSTPLAKKMIAQSWKNIESIFGVKTAGTNDEVEFLMGLFLHLVTVPEHSSKRFSKRSTHETAAIPGIVFKGPALNYFKWNHFGDFFCLTSSSSVFSQAPATFCAYVPGPSVSLPVFKESRMEKRSDGIISPAKILKLLCIFTFILLSSAISQLPSLKVFLSYMLKW